MRGFLFFKIPFQFLFHSLISQDSISVVPLSIQLALVLEYVKDLFVFKKPCVVISRFVVLQSIVPKELCLNLMFLFKGFRVLVSRMSMQSQHPPYSGAIRLLTVLIVSHECFCEFRKQRTIQIFRKQICFIFIRGYPPN